MPIGTIYKLDKTILASGQELHAIASSDIQHGIKTMVERSAGEVWPSHNRCVDLSPKQTTTYTLTIADATGKSATQSIELKVQ